MAFQLKSETNLSITREELEKKIREEVERYVTHVLKSNEVDYVFLKSVIYAEGLVKEVNKKLHGTDERTSLEKHLELMDLITDPSVKRSIQLFRQIKPFRNTLAHKLEYRTEDDPMFIKRFKFVETEDIEAKKKKIADYFNSIVHGILFVKIGIEYSQDFIYYIDK